MSLYVYTVHYILLFASIHNASHYSNTLSPSDFVVPYVGTIDIVCCSKFNETVAFTCYVVNQQIIQKRYFVILIKK